MLNHKTKRNKLCWKARFEDSPEIRKTKMSRLVTKATYWHMCPVKTPISLGICPVWSESSLYTQWVVKDTWFLHADSEASDQTGQMPRLIWVFAECLCHFVGFVTRRLKLSSKLYIAWISMTCYLSGSIDQLFYIGCCIPCDDCWCMILKCAC